MEKIIKTQEPKFNDYWNFDKAFSAIVGDDLEIDSIDYTLNNSLTSDKFDSYDKSIIMKHLLDVAKELKK